MNNPDSERLVASRSELTGQQVSDRFPKKDVEGIDAVMEEEEHRGAISHCSLAIKKARLRPRSRRPSGRLHRDHSLLLFVQEEGMIPKVAQLEARGRVQIHELRESEQNGVV